MIAPFYNFRFVCAYNFIHSQFFVLCFSGIYHHFVASVTLVPSPSCCTWRTSDTNIIFHGIYTHLVCEKMFSRETCSCLQFQRQYTSAVAMCVRCEIKDRIVFTCTVTGSGALLWAVESLFSS